MGSLENSELSVPQGKRKLRERIVAVPNYSRGNDSSDEISDNDANLPDKASQLQKNHPGNLAKNGATLTAKQKYYQEYHNLNRARLLEYKREHYSRNRERILERQRKYRSEKKDFYKDYYAKNQEKFKARARKYRAENKEKINERVRKYQAENREILNEKRKKYVSENKEKMNERIRNKHYQIEYRHRNIEKLREYKKAYHRRNIEKWREYAKAHYHRNKERLNEKARALYQSRKRPKKEEKNKRLYEAYNWNKSPTKQKLTPIIRSDLIIKPALPMMNEIPPVLKTCVVLLEKLNIPESSLKSFELNHLGLSEMPRKPKLPKTITKKSFATERRSKLAEPLSEIQKNCILVDSSERGNNLRVLIVKSDATYLQKMFLEVEKMLGV